MRAKGRDAAGRGYKFFLVASYSFPKFKDQKAQEPHQDEDMAPLDCDFADMHGERAASGAVDPMDGELDDNEELDSNSLIPTAIFIDGGQDFQHQPEIFAMSTEGYRLDMARVLSFQAASITNPETTPAGEEELAKQLK